jgi:phosphoglycerate dehydrogenase-like enzyme
MTKTHYNLLITSFLEPEWVEKIEAVDPRLNVINRPDLIGIPRYAADHTAPLRELSPAQEAKWRALLAEADILFDFDWHRAAELPDLAPNVQWIQATSAGIGQFVARNRYGERMPNTRFTTASGVHAVPLAEFCMMAMLMHFRGLAHLQSEQARHHWERFATTDMTDKTVAIVGLGRIGKEVARLSKAFGMRVIGTKARENDAQVDEFYPPDRLHEMLGVADVVVLIVPHTPDTEKMIGAPEFTAMKNGAYLINIARGAVVDEPAMIEALQRGKLAGAALDVFAVEPLPAESPLWEMPNVLVSPHSASTSDRENERIVDLFCDNLRRFLDGQPLRNQLDVERMY